MSTNALIGKLNKDGSVDYIYCHNDGDPDSIVPILTKIIDNGEFDHLISLGSISCLYEKLDPPKGAKHTFDNPIKGVTVAYHRDRGDPFHICKAPDVCEFTRCVNNEDYAYIVDTTKKGESAITVIE